MKDSQFTTADSQARRRANTLLWLLAIAYCLLSVPARGALELTPGFTFSDVSTSPNRIVTSNRLFTLVGSAVPLPGLITNRTLATITDTNFYWLASSNGVLYRVPGALLIPTNSLNGTNIASGIAGIGLSQDTDFSLRVNVDTNTVKITNDVLTLNLTTFSNLVAIISTNIALYYSTNITANHAANVTGWAKFAGTNQVGTYNPNAGVNISNIIRTALGRYTVNFTNAMASTNYGIHIQIMDATVRYVSPNIVTQSTNAFSIDIVDNSGNVFADPQFLYIQTSQ